MKRPDKFVPLDVNLPSDESIAAAGVDAEHLFVRGLMYCKRVGKDGFIPAYELPVIAARMSKVQSRVDALVREELWLPVEGGWRIRSWHRWNESTEAERLRRDRDAERQKRRRDSTPNPDGVTTDVQRDTAVSPSPRGRGRGEVEEIPTTSAQLEVIGAQTAGTLMAEHLDHCAERPPGRVVGQTSRLVKELLTEGIPPEQVRAGLEALRSKSLNPSTLPSLVNEARNPARRRSTTDDRVAAGAELIAKYADLEGLR